MSEISPNKETEQEKLLLWRAITGRLIQGNEYEGFEDLDEVEFFTSNLSAAQYGRGRPLLLNTRNRLVPGLPVFLNSREAISWLEPKVFKFPPVLGCLVVPVSMFSNETLKLVRNTMTSQGDSKLTVADIEAVIKGEKEITGEAYLAGKSSPQLPLDLLRDKQKLYIPTLNSEGKIDRSSLSQSIT